MRASYHILNSGMRHGMTFAVVLLLITVSIISFLWRNWDNITLKLSYEGEKKLKIVVAVVLGLCFIGIIICGINGLYNY